MGDGMHRRSAWHYYFNYRFNDRKRRHLFEIAPHACCSWNVFAFGLSTPILIGGFMAYFDPEAK